MKKHQEYVARDYHKPSDAVKPDCDLAGAVEDLRLLLALGYTVAQMHAIPHWMSTSEFKARRVAMMRASR
jgi:hypothetical protein